MASLTYRSLNTQSPCDADTSYFGACVCLPLQMLCERIAAYQLSLSAYYTVYCGGRARAMRCISVDILLFLVSISVFLDFNFVQQ